MKVRDLITLLELHDPDDEVVLQRDAEGNGYSPLSACWEGRYRADSEWSGEARIRELTDELREQGYTEADLGGDGFVSALVLQPRN